jgi:hypothetical protein
MCAVPPDRVQIGVRALVVAPQQFDQKRYLEVWPGFANILSFRYCRDFFGWRSRLLTREQAGRGQSAIGDQKNVCAKPLRWRWRLWALNDRRVDSRCPAHVWRTPEPGGLTEPVARRQRECEGQRTDSAGFRGIVMVRGR